jgi:hypothetical protein
MKKFYSLIAILLFAAGCTTSSKLMQRGRFEAALERSVKELRRNPTNADEILVLERAYRIQNERDWERINFLKLNNDPRHLEELITLYTRLKDRQSLVRTVLPLNLPDRVINYPYINYDEEIVAARFAAADYYYNNALQLMDQGDKASYRQAHLEFQRVKRYSTTHRDIDRMIQDSKLLGISRVLVMVQNHTPLNLGTDFQDQLLAISTRELDKEWIEYHFRDLDENLEYDYLIVANIRLIDVSRDITRETDRLESKRIQDGFEYVLDQNGNVAKDSLGNDLRTPRYVTVSCALIETQQLKYSAIEGDVEFISMNPRRLLKKEPVGASSTFEHISARAIGDLAALDEETLKMITLQPVDFPDEFDMVFRTAESMRLAISEVIHKNRHLIQ